MPRHYSVHVYHKSQHVGTENVKARDISHAHQLGAYIAGTVAREAVRPADFDRSRVHFQVHDPEDEAS